MLRNLLNREAVTIGAEHPVYLLLQCVLGCMLLLDKDSGAEALVERGVSAMEKVAGQTYPELPVMLNLLAATWAAVGRYEEAEALTRRYLSVAESTFGATSVPYGKALSNLGSIMVKRGEFGEALPVLMQALAVLGGGVEDAAMASVLSDLALCSARLGELDAAEEYARQSVERFRRVGFLELGKLGALLALAVILDQRGDPEAPASAREALDLVRVLELDLEDADFKEVLALLQQIAGGRGVYLT
jgi:tetratricopeptide (TPR) repeat protein